MAFQGLLREEDKITGFVGDVKGSELIGCRVKAPNSIHGEVYVLPMDTVLATKVISLSQLHSVLSTDVILNAGNWSCYLRSIRFT
jgi:hypothetical protein